MMLIKIMKRRNNSCTRKKKPGKERKGDDEVKDKG